MTTQPSKFFITSAVLGGILAVSTSSVFIRFANRDAPSLGIAAYRLLIAILILSPYALTRYRSELTGLTRREILPGLLSGIFLALHFATWISSLEFTTVASSVVLVTTTPLWVALLSPLLLREPTGKTVITGMFFALLGGTIVGLADSCTWQGTITCPPLSSFIHGSTFFGDLLALSGAWMAAGYIMIGRSLRAKMSLIPYIFLVYGMAAIVLLIILIISGQPAYNYHPATYLWLFLLAVIPQLLGHSTFNWALGYLPASLVSITLLGEPIGSTILAYVILGEKPSGLKILGAIFILAGIYVASNKQSGTILEEELIAND